VNTGRVRISFAEFVLDTTTFELRQGGTLAPMAP
jgi:hypothetical protein